MMPTAPMSDDGELLTLGKAARLLGCGMTTVRRLEDAGALPAHGDAARRHLYLREDIERLAAARLAAGRVRPRRSDARRELVFSPDHVDELAARGCRDERQQVTPAAVLLALDRRDARFEKLLAQFSAERDQAIEAFAQLRGRVRELEALSTAEGRNVTPRAEKNSFSASSSTSETFRSDVPSAKLTSSA
jgi:DNA-binding transcriptional MerR regulator